MQILRNHNLFVSIYGIHEIYVKSNIDRQIQAAGSLIILF